MKWEWNETKARGQLATLGNPKVQSDLSQKPYPFVSTSQPRAMNPTRISVCKDLEPPALNPSLFPKLSIAGQAPSIPITPWGRYAIQAAVDVYPTPIAPASQ